MKKIRLLFAVCLCIVSLAVLSHAEENRKEISLPSFQVTLNERSVYSSYREYPLIVYNDITYFPMTYHDCRYLGLTTSWDEETRTLEIEKASDELLFAYSENRSSTFNSRTDTASVCSFNIVVNGKPVINAEEEYPLLVYRDVTYFPLTWRFAHDEFGWSYNFDAQTGLDICSYDFDDSYAYRRLSDVGSTSSTSVSKWSKVSSIQQFDYIDKGIAYAYLSEGLLYVVTPEFEFSTTALHPLLGDVISDDAGNFYVVWGFENPSEYDYDTETVFITKYSPSGNLITSCGFVGTSKMSTTGNTKEPFRHGKCESAIHDGVLMVNYARGMYNGHQSNNVIGVYTDDMTPVVYSSMWDIPYCSHSFNQDVIWSDQAGCFVYMDHGDAYDRGFILSSDKNPTRKNLFHFYLPSNASYNMYIVNTTYAQLGGLVETSAGVMLVGASVKTLGPDAENEKQNLFVQVFDPTASTVSPQMFVTEGEREGDTAFDINDTQNAPLTKVCDYGVAWITDNTEKDVVCPHAVRAGDKVVVLWSEKSKSYNESFYVVLEADGTIAQPKTSLGLCALNSTEDPIYRDGRVYWVAVSNGICAVSSFAIED